MQFKLTDSSIKKFSKHDFDNAVVKGTVVIDYPRHLPAHYTDKISGAYIYLYGKYWHCPYIDEIDPELFAERYFDWFEITPNEIINVTFNIKG